MKKCILSLLLILSVVFSTPVTFAEEKSLPDGEKAYEILTALGLLDENEDVYTPGAVIERGELVKLIAKVCGIIPSDGEAVFSDVDEKSEENKYIRAAYASGLIHGDENGYFYPYEPATEGHLLKMAATALGYEYYASVKGGWQNGYLNIAKRAGLTEGLHINMNAEATYEFVMVMLLNLAEADIMEAVGFSGESTQMATTEGKNILSEVHDIYIMEESIVEATPYTHLLAADSGIEKGSVYVGGKEFKDLTENAVSLIGQCVKAYYHEDAENSATLLHISEDEKHNNIFKLKPSDVISADFDSLRYRTENDSVKKLSFSDNLTPLLNGKLTAFSELLFKFEIGEITFIDNNDDNKYEVINIMSYNNYVVSGVNAVDSIVAMEDGVRKEFDPKADEYGVIFIKDGEYTDIDAVLKGTVISVAESAMNKGTGLKVVLISDEIVDGKIEGTTEDGVIIDGEEILVRSSFSDDATAGREGTFRLDAFGYIWCIDETIDIVYGYLKHMYKDDFDDVQCRIFTENGNWVNLKFRKKVRFNGETEPKEDVYITIGGETDTYRQLIRYLVNNDGEITTLDTAQKFSIGSKEEKGAIEDNSFRLAYDGRLMFRNNFNTFNGKFLVDGNTKIFDIPTEARADEGKYHIIDMTKLSDDTEYQVKAYDLDDMTRAKAVVTTISGGGTINAYSKFMVVYSVKKIYHEDENTIDAIKGYWNGTECTIPVKLPADSAVKVSDLNRGDILQISFDTDGNIAKITKHAYGNGYYLKNMLYSLNTQIAGKVNNIDTAEGIILLTYQENGDSAGIKLVKNIRVTIYDSADGRCRPGTVEDIIKGDTVIASMHQLTAQELMVIR